MKQQFVLFILVIMLTRCSSDADRYLYLDGTTNKWGYKNSNGAIMLSAKYDDARQFQDGLALVKFNGNNYYIDKFERKWLNAPHDGNLADIGEFSNGWAFYNDQKADEFGYMDKDGEKQKITIQDQRVKPNPKDFVIDGTVTFDHHLYDFDDGYLDDFRVQKQRTKGDYLLGWQDSEKSISIIDRAGDVIVTKDSTETFNPVYGNRFLKSVTKDSVTRWYICKASNGKVIKDITELGSDRQFRDNGFRDGLMKVSKDGFVNYYDEDGDLILSKRKYDGIQYGYFEGGYATIEKKVDGEWFIGLMNKKGEEVLPPTFDWLKHHKDDIFIASDYTFSKGKRKKLLTEKKHYIRPNGEILFALGEIQHNN